jgi:tetratricopeptide (TPR) repeat protein
MIKKNLLPIALLAMAACSPMNISQDIQRAETLRQQEKYDEARKVLEKVISAESITSREKARACKELGNTWLLGNDDLDRAAMWYQKSAEADPQYENAIHNLGLVELKRFEQKLTGKNASPEALGHLNKAEEYFLNALTKNPRFALSAEELSKVYFYKKDYKKALEQIRTARKYSGQNSRMLLIEGQIFQKGLKDPKSAFRLYEEAFAIDRKNPTVVYYLVETASSVSREKYDYYQSHFKSIAGMTTEEFKKGRLIDLNLRSD